MEQQHTWHISCVKAKESIRPLNISPLQSRCNVCRSRQDVCTNNTSVIPKDCSHFFFADGAFSDFFLEDAMWRHYNDCHSDSGLKLWTQSTSSMTTSNTKLPLLYRISGRDQCICFHCLFVCSCQHSWQHVGTDPETVKLFSKYHDTAFADG
jgi:hypothetical protein